MQANERSGLSRRTFLAGGAFAAAAAGFALTGCDTMGRGSSESPGESATEPQPSEIAAVLAYPATDANPVGNTSALMVAAGWHVFDGLYNLDMRTFEPYEGLAQGDPVQVSETEYEVKLRPNARFSNGETVTVDDVVNAFELNRADETYGALLAFVGGVRAKDESTVSFTLNYPFSAYLKQRLALVRVFPASLDQNTLNTAPVGSGPWAFEQVDASDGGEVTFVPNPNYEGPFPAGADAMKWKVVSDASARAGALQDDAAAVAEDVAANDADQLTSSGSTVDFVQGFKQAFLMFNCQKEPFNDARVRQAFFYAIDVDNLIANAFDGHAAPVTGFLPQGHPNYHEASTVYDYDPERARELLEEAGVEEIDVTLVVNDNWVRDLAETIKSDLDAVGINTTLDEQRVDWNDYLPRDDDAVNRAFDVMLSAGDPTYLGNDPDLLLSWWYGENAWTQGRSYWAKANDPRFATLQELLQQARESEGAGQQALWNECFDIVAESVPLYALFHCEVATGYRADRVSGVQPISTSGLFLLGAAPA